MSRARAARARAARPVRPVAARPAAAAQAAPQFPQGPYARLAAAQAPGGRFAPYGWAPMRAQVLPTLIDAARSARVHQVRAGLTLVRAQVDRLQSGLDAWDRQLAAVTDDTAPTVPYDTADTGAVAPPPPPPAAQPPAVVVPAAQPAVVVATPTATSPGRTTPSSRVLFAIFDDLPEHAHLTESGYPRMSWINEELEDQGIGTADTAWVHQKYDAWLHARAYDRAEEAEGEGSSPGKRPTDSVLVSIYAKLDLDDPNVVTKAGTPRVSVVTEELEDRGYAPADADQVADTFADWQKEDASATKSPKKPTDDALFAVFAKLDLNDPKVVTKSGQPRQDVVADALAKNGYAPADAEQIAEAFQDWKAGER